MQKLATQNKDYVFNYALFNYALIAIFLVLSIAAVVLGVQGIVENKTPTIMSSLSTLGSSVLEQFEYHILIFAGALGFISAIWILDHQP